MGSKNLEDKFLFCRLKRSVCEVEILGYDVYKLGYVNLPIVNPENDPAVLIELSESFDETKFDTNFYVDGNIMSKDGTITFVGGVYALDKSIGKFGGYKIAVKL